MAESVEFFSDYILNAYDAYHESFKEITRRAETRFRKEDWKGIRSDAVERLDLYTHSVDVAVKEILDRLIDVKAYEENWSAVKDRFALLVESRHDYHLAETFFNSVSRRVFGVMGVRPEIEFTVSDFRLPLLQEDICTDCTLMSGNGENSRAKRIVETIFDQFGDRIEITRKDRDCNRVAGAIEKHLAEHGLSTDDIRVEMADPVFYRDKIAYLVGRMVTPEGFIPLVLCLLCIQEEIFVDAVIFDANDVSILFSFANSYFHVDVDYPEEMISFLKTIIPRKPVSEIYTSIGFHKHGKAEFFRELTRSLAESEHRFEPARGEKGMVMLVFTMPALNVVFKMIRDRFERPKDVTPDFIQNRYELVFKHDRVGRLVDAQEFRYMKFDKASFSEEVLAELTEKAKNNIIISDDKVIIKHLYTERRLTPLDIYIRENSPENVDEVFMDYGWSIKELAASNIFPGDLLLKNFGVTRHHRVVFYDYDELTLLSGCRFRKMPEPRTYDDMMSDEPWFPVYENDVFPEQFRNFIHVPDHVKERFENVHGDLFDIKFWREMQAMLESGTVIYILPYRRGYRFENDIGDAPVVFFNNQG